LLWPARDFTGFFCKYGEKSGGIFVFHNRDKINPAEVSLRAQGEGIYFVMFIGPGEILGD